MATGTAKRGRLAFLLWLFIGIFYVAVSWSYISAVRTDDELGDYLQFAVNLAGIQNRSRDDIRELVLAKARDLELEIEESDLRVEGRGKSLALVVDYDVQIPIPLFWSNGYTKRFSHDVGFRTIQ